MVIYPDKLKKGDEVRIIAPSTSFSVISEEQKEIAINRLESIGLKVSFGKNIHESDIYTSSSIDSRVEDLHDAFKDKNVKAILTVLGGLNANQMLDYIDFDLIKNNPKIFCGYSDITALQNAILAKTGLVTYSGPHFASFGMKKGFDHTLDYFKKSFLQNKPFEIEDSKEWSNDKWFLDQENRHFYKNEGTKVFQEGKAKGTIIGGNLCTLNLLQGTKYMPKFKDVILFLEDVEMMEGYSGEFDRNLQSLIHSEDFSQVKALVIGRAMKDTDFSLEKLSHTVNSKKELKNIPVLYDADFGHTYPIVTFPIGGEVSIDTYKQNKIEILKH